MKMSSLLSTGGICCALLYILHNLVWIHPFPPSIPLAFTAAGCAAIAFCSTCNLKQRVLAVITAVAVLLVTFFRADSWARFSDRQREHVLLVSSAQTLRIKLLAYLDAHPEAASTNLADYLAAGLEVGDTNLLRGASVRLFPKASGRDCLVEIERGEIRLIVPREGEIYQASETE